MLGQKNQKIGVIVQARMDSTRLPGKVLMELNKNERVLDLLIMRLKLSKFLNEIIIATTPKKKNSLIIEAAESHNVSFFIGSEKNVLERYYKAAKQFNLDIVIRATSDNPFVDPFILDDMIEFYQENNYDCIKNVSHGSTNFPVGFDIEIFSFEVLESVYKLVEDNWDKEHVTRYIYDHPKDFTIFLYNKNILALYGIFLGVYFLSRTFIRTIMSKLFLTLSVNSPKIKHNMILIVNGAAAVSFLFVSLFF